jgi:hypothetical protein
LNGARQGDTGLFQADRLLATHGNFSVPQDKARKGTPMNDVEENVIFLEIAQKLDAIILRGSAHNRPKKMEMDEADRSKT